MAKELAQQVNVAVPSGADTWTDIGDITVPAEMKRVKRVEFGIAPDWGTTAGSVRMAPVFRLGNAGLGENDPHDFLGMFASTSTVTTGGAALNDLNASYDVDIPVQSGGVVTARVNSLDEAVTAGTCFANVIFDDQPAKAKNSMAQYIDAAGTTTAGAYASVGTITIPQPDPARQPTKITKMCIGVAPDQGTSAISLRSSPVIRLAGAGLKGSGLRDYIGPLQYSGHIGTSASQGAYHDKCTMWRDVDIEINAGGQITVEHQFITETPTASTVAVGFLYA